MADTRHPVAAGVNSANTLVPWKRDPLPKSRSAAPGWQGATTEPYWAYAREKQRRQPGCPARELGDGTRFQGTSSPWCKSGVAPRPARRPAGKARRAKNIGQYLSEEQRRPPGCRAGRMQPDLRHGLLASDERASPADGKEAPAWSQTTVSCPTDSPVLRSTIPTGCWPTPVAGPMRSG